MYLAPYLAINVYSAGLSLVGWFVLYFLGQLHSLLSGLSKITSSHRSAFKTENVHQIYCAAFAHLSHFQSHLHYVCVFLHGNKRKTKQKTFVCTIHPTL